MGVTKSYNFPRLFYWRVLDLDILSLRFSCLCLAILVYAALSSPTPDNPGITEAVIGVLLLASAGPGRLGSLFRFRFGQAFWKQALKLLMIYGMSVPLIIGIYQGHSLHVIMRDLLPFGFMALPFLVFDIFHARPRYFKIFLAVVVIAGLCFSLRAIFESFSHFLPFFLRGEELTYFANAPTVLFSALVLMAAGCGHIWRGGPVYSLLLFSLCFLLSGFAIIAMGFSLQRASLAYAALYGLILLGFMGGRHPVFILVIILGLFSLTPLFNLFQEVFDLLWQKTKMYGVNRRLDEFWAVWGVVSKHPFSIIFGQGWGANFHSPAVGDMEVQYTHSLLSSMLLKGGVIGMGLVCAYLYGLWRILWGIIWQRLWLGLALAGPFLISALLYASYKSLDFGLLLTLIPASFMVIKIQRLHKATA